MTGDPSPEAWLSEDGRTVHMRRGGWEVSFPVESLDGWLAFYRQLMDRKGGKFAAIYAPEVEALEQVRCELWTKRSKSSCSLVIPGGKDSGQRGKL